MNQPCEHGGNPLECPNHAPDPDFSKQIESLQEAKKVALEGRAMSDLVSRDEVLKTLRSAMLNWRQKGIAFHHAEEDIKAIPANAVGKTLTREQLDAMIEEVLPEVDLDSVLSINMSGVLRHQLGKYRDAILARMSPTPVASNPEWKGEWCEECDRRYGESGLVWRATNDLWQLLGWEDRGMLCPDCFVKRLDAKGVTPYFAAVDDETFQRLMSSTSDCPELKAHGSSGFKHAHPEWKCCPFCGAELS